MIKPVATSLFLEPDRVYVQAQIVSLTREMADNSIRRDWWDDPSLKPVFDEPQPIDRHWNWNDFDIEYEGEILAPEKVAIVAGDDRAVQGAMMISIDPVPSMLDPGAKCLFIELLFTAPRNRPNLRRDGMGFLRAVGTELLIWGARFSRERGYGGRLRLDGSPDYLTWYQKRGLQPLGVKPILFEGVSYTPMELSSKAADQFLE